MNLRARVLLLEADRLAVIERWRAGQHYYVLPGGGVESGESPASAAAREVAEELGLLVAIGPCVAILQDAAMHQQIFLATRIGGAFGTGDGAEVSGMAAPTRGCYQPGWLPLAALSSVDLRPNSLIPFLQAWQEQGRVWPTAPVALRA